MPTAFDISTAATDESTPPESAHSTFPVPTFSLIALYRIVYKGVPSASLRCIRTHLLRNAPSIFMPSCSMHHLRMEAAARTGLPLTVFHSRHRADRRVRRYCKAFGRPGLYNRYGSSSRSSYPHTSAEQPAVVIYRQLLSCRIR